MVPRIKQCSKFDEEMADVENEDGVEYADLPDLSEYEDMINWEEDKDQGEPSNT